MLNSTLSTKGSKRGILELRAIVTADRSQGTRKFRSQTKNKIMIMIKSFILRSKKEHPSVSQKIIDYDKNVPFATG